MKILESTQEQLVIGREKSESFELMCLAVWVNIVVSICGAATLPLFKGYTYVLCFAIGWLLIHLAFPRDRGIASYLSTVVFGSIPFLGIFLLSLSVISLLQFPHIASLTFDKDKNLLIIKKSKFIFWYPTNQYPLGKVIVDVTLATKNFYGGSGCSIISALAVLLARRGRNGRVIKKTILVGANATWSLVDQINRFLVLH